MLMQWLVLQGRDFFQLGWLKKGKGHSDGFIASVSYLKREQSTLVLVMGEWKRTRMLDLLCRGQKQKLDDAIMQVAGKLCQTPSFSSITAFLDNSTKVTSTSILILFVILTNNSHDTSPSSTHKGRLISRISTNQTYFARLMAQTQFHCSWLDIFNYKFTFFVLRLNTEKPRLYSSFLSNQNKKSLWSQGRRVQQLVTVGSSLCLESVVEAIRVK